MRASHAIAASLLLGAFACAAGADDWWSPGDGKAFPAQVSYDNPYGAVGLLNADGALETRGHAFFEPLGSNGRACVSCHQPADAMSLSLASIKARWEATSGKDAIFAAIDGSNCPSLPQQVKSSHSLLLEQGLFRIALPWPPRNAYGQTLRPEFTIEVVSDPSGCNNDAVYGLKSKQPRVSVFRRPRMAANLSFVANPRNRFNSRSGMPNETDPETGSFVSMNILADARQPTLKLQAIEAAGGHLQRAAPLDAKSIQQIVSFEMQLYGAQIRHRAAGELVEPNGPDALGPGVLARTKVGALGDNLQSPVFGRFDAWRSTDKGDAQREFRASVARGYDVFFLRPFWIRDAAHLNSIGLGNPIKRTCSTCHNSNLMGQDIAPAYMDIGVANLPWANETTALPVFKLTCDKLAVPHPYLGRVVYTHDPGRALASGKCEDIGSINMQQLRGLAARAPYFSNGSAANLEAIVDYYERRFSLHLSPVEKTDLVNFLSVL